MHPAKKSQIAVCKSFIPTRTNVRSEWGFTRDPSLEDLSIRSATIPRFSENVRSSRGCIVLADQIQSIVLGLKMAYHTQHEHTMKDELLQKLLEILSTASPWATKPRELTGRSKTRNGDDRPSGPVSWRLERAFSARAWQRRRKDRRQQRPNRAACGGARCHLPLNNG
jgi:hypothetical protein